MFTIISINIQQARDVSLRSIAFFKDFLNAEMHVKTTVVAFSPLLRFAYFSIAHHFATILGFRVIAHIKVIRNCAE